MPELRFAAIAPALALLMAGAGSAQSQTADFRWLAGLAGACWSGVFPDGKTRHTQCYRMQFDRFLRGSASLSIEQNGVSRLQFEGDSVFAADPANASIVYYIWGSDGSHRQLSAHFSGDEILFPVPSRKAPHEIAYRSVWRRVSDNAFEVRRERPAAGGWSVELTVMYRRDTTGPRVPSQ